MITTQVSALEPTLSSSFSGKLNEDYLRELLMTTGDRYTDDQVDELLREAPIDANGDFDYIEFVKILKNGKVDPDANKVEMVKLE